jgi:hypothetical protein
MNNYTELNYVFLALGLINGTLFVMSEAIGFMNRHTTRCTSLVELAARWLNLVREPTLEEALEHLQARREAQLEAARVRELEARVTPARFANRMDDGAKGVLHHFGA